MLVASLGPVAPAAAQERPRHGGELIFVVPHLAKVRGWTVTPSHFLNQQLDTVWLSE